LGGPAKPCQFCRLQVQSSPNHSKIFEIATVLVARSILQAVGVALSQRSTWLVEGGIELFADERGRRRGAGTTPRRREGRHGCAGCVVVLGAGCLCRR